MSIIWLTGVPGVGKTTVACQLERDVDARVLDADICRAAFWPELTWSDEDRYSNVMRLARLAALLFNSIDLCSSTYIAVACIAPLQRARIDAAKLIEAVTGYKLDFIWLTAPQEVLFERDPKGIYSCARAGSITGVTGYDAPYEEPLPGEVLVRYDTSTMTPREISAAIRSLV